MTKDNNKGQRATHFYPKTGGARGPAAVWTPTHADPVASARIWRLAPLDRADVARRASLELISKSTDPEVRSLGYLLHDAVADGVPERFVRDAGLVVAGGHHSLEEQRGRRWRDAKLRQLLRQEPYSGMTPRAAARAILKEFRRYETRNWPRDRASGRLPQAGPTALWSQILAREIYMPRSIPGLLLVFAGEA